jgi:hypothetical protein
MNVAVNDHDDRPAATGDATESGAFQAAPVANVHVLSEADGIPTWYPADVGAA